MVPIHTRALGPRVFWLLCLSCLPDIRIGLKVPLGVTVRPLGAVTFEPQICTCRVSIKHSLRGITEEGWLVLRKPAMNLLLGSAAGNMISGTPLSPTVVFIGLGTSEAASVSRSGA